MSFVCFLLRVEHARNDKKSLYARCDPFAVVGMRRSAGCHAGKPSSIGVATMSADGTITLQLRAEGAGGTIGDAVFVYRPGDTMYQEIKRHIGDIKPGETKPVPPWTSPPSH